MGETSAESGAQFNPVSQAEAGGGRQGQAAPDGAATGHDTTPSGYTTHKWVAEMHAVIDVVTPMTASEELQALMAKFNGLRIEVRTIQLPLPRPHK